MSQQQLKSIAIAQAVAACINAQGGIGPIGGKECEIDENKITLYSQMPAETFMFDDKGRATLLHPEDVYRNIKYANDMSNEEMVDAFGTVEDFKKDNTNMDIEDFFSVSSWFCGSNIEKTCIEFVKAITL